MRYFGSKASTAGAVYDAVAKRVPGGSLCDPFGGTGIMGSRFKSRGWEVWSGDILSSAHCFQVARVHYDVLPRFRRLLPNIGASSTDDLLSVLNRADTRNGWLIEEFSRRRPCFTPGNAGRIEACRQLITEWMASGWLGEHESAFLLASLVESFDRVANTAGTYYSFLKSWHKKAMRPFSFEFIMPTWGAQPCRAFLADAQALVRKRCFDVLYLDPPYNDRNYARYYHLPESIACCAEPASARKSGVPSETKAPSEFGSRSAALPALRRLIDSARWRLLVLHYADGGALRHGDILQLLGEYGPVEETTVTALGYTTSSHSRSVPQRLYMVANA